MYNEQHTSSTSNPLTKWRRRCWQSKLSVKRLRTSGEQMSIQQSYREDIHNLVKKFQHRLKSQNFLGKRHINGNKINSHSRQIINACNENRLKQAMALSASADLVSHSHLLPFYAWQAHSQTHTHSTKINSSFLNNSAQGI